jgi:hypothetical protein
MYASYELCIPFTTSGTTCYKIRDRVCNSLPSQQSCQRNHMALLTSFAAYDSHQEESEQDEACHRVCKLKSSLQRDDQGIE